MNILNLIISKSSQSDDVSERLLFHGIRGAVPMEILNHPDAFMDDYSSGRFYGRVLYFAETKFQIQINATCLFVL